MPVPTEADRALEIRIDDRLLPGPWRSKTGTEVTAPDDKVYPGHMQAAVSVGGTPALSNTTVTALFKYEVWLDLARWLRSRTGPGAATITELWLDKQRHVFGTGDTFTGSLIRSKTPDYDAENGGSPGVIELEFSLDGP